jgi:hypothetical protein
MERLEKINAIMRMAVLADLAYTPNPQEYTVEGIEKEYELIKQKKSKYSKKIRDHICKLYHGIQQSKGVTK